MIRLHSVARQAFEDTFGLTGQLLDGQYRADGVVGEGGFGVVYRGRHLSLDQPIAIKVLKGLDGGDERINALVLEKFRAEARLLYTLSQSSLHIVRSLNYGAAAMPTGIWAPFMILEWLEGRSLADDIKDRRRAGLRGRSLAETLAILEPVAAGLAVAHGQRVAHRDIKPANVFLLIDPTGPRVKLLDFGIAKIMKDGESAGSKGTFASFTWLYAAPEQVDPRYGQTGLATDVYAFALLMTELMTDRPPADEGDVLSIMRAATDVHQRPTPRTRGAQLPDAVDQILVKALAVDPLQRYPSIVELWDALSRGRNAGTSSVPSVVIPSSAPGGDASPYARTNVPVYGQAPPPPRMTTGPRSPPIGTPPPGWMPPMQGPPMMMGPPPGTAPPRAIWGATYRRLGEATNPWLVAVIVLVAVFTLFSASCTMCGAFAAIGQQAH